MYVEFYKNYEIFSVPIRMDSGKWYINGHIHKTVLGELKKHYYSDLKLLFLLEKEAKLEGISLAKGIIDSGVLKF